VTKERIRQIEARALSKLRQAAQEEKILLIRSKLSNQEVIRSATFPRKVADFIDTPVQQNGPNAGKTEPKWAFVLSLFERALGWKSAMQICCQSPLRPSARPLY
jgi:hypothetical protein